MTPDPGVAPGELGASDGSRPGGLLAYRSARGRWVVAAMILGSSVAGIDSTVVAVALPAIGRNLHADFQALQWTVTSYTLALASLILLASFAQISWICTAAFAGAAVLSAAFITGSARPTPARQALIQTPVPHLICPVAFRHAPGPRRGHGAR